MAEARTAKHAERAYCSSGVWCGVVKTMLLTAAVNNVFDRKMTRRECEACLPREKEQAKIIMVPHTASDRILTNIQYRRRMPHNTSGA